MASIDTSTATLRRHAVQLGQGDPVVIVHGALSTSADFLPLAELLAPTRSVVLPDRRGYGRSDLGPAPFTFGQDGADLTAVLESLPAPAVLFGHSAGGVATLHAAHHRPNLVSALVLYEPAGPALPQLLDRFRRLRAEQGAAAALAAFISAGGGPDEATLRQQLTQPEWSTRLAMTDAVERDLTAQVALPTPDQYDLGQVPLTVLVGEKSGPSTRERAAYLANQTPKAQVRELRGQGHLANLFAPHLLAEELIRATRHL